MKNHLNLFFCSEFLLLIRNKTCFPEIVYFIFTGIKELVHAFSCAYIELWMHWEVWRALKKLELLSATPRATLTLLSCSPNFPRASITRYTHAKHEPILKCYFMSCYFYVTLRYVMLLCYVIVMLRYVTLCYVVMLCYVIATLRYVTLR